MPQYVMQANTKRKLNIATIYSTNVCSYSKMHKSKTSGNPVLQPKSGFLWPKKARLTCQTQVFTSS